MAARALRIEKRRGDQARRSPSACGARASNEPRKLPRPQDRRAPLARNPTGENTVVIQTQTHLPR
jgi:hypothetical protein